jgi:hypothetical protein
MSMSVASVVREQVEAVAPGGFVHAERIDGPRNGVAIELHRMARRGDLVHVHRGLYWVPDGAQAQPAPASVALEVGGVGSGPSSVSAARMLGLTTQVPSFVAMAVPRRVQHTIPGVRLHQRPSGRREMGLRPMEVAVVEVLRAAPAVVEGPDTEIAHAVDTAIGRGSIRVDLIDEVVRHERDLAARRRWDSVSALLAVASTGV